MTLVEFLLARIGEDEQRARAIAEFSEADGHHAWIHGNVVGASEYDLTLPVSGGRLLAECEAKRRIVELNDRALREAVDERDASGMGAGLMHADVLKLLAFPYADHPDYNPDWRP